MLLKIVIKRHVMVPEEYYVGDITKWIKKGDEAKINGILLSIIRS